MKNVFIIQRDGGRTQIDASFLVKLAQAGRLSPETPLEVDGERKRAFELEPLAEYFNALGYVAPPEAPAPPREGAEPTIAVPAPEVASARHESLALTELEIARLAAQRVAVRYKGEKTICQIVTALAVMRAFVAIAELLVMLAFEGASNRVGVGTALLSVLGTALALTIYYGARECFRANALLREESAIRREERLQNTPQTPSLEPLETSR